jgi:hypothetical protein
MVLREIVQTCSNAEVAKAALASIGGKFAEHVAAEASRSNLTPGMLTSLIVKEFLRSDGGCRHRSIWNRSAGSVGLASDSHSIGGIEDSAS